MRVLVFKSGDMCYGSLRFFTDLMCEAFKAAGIEVIECDFIPEPGMVKSRVNFVFGFNMMLDKKDENGENIYDKMDVPIVDFIVDHPMMHKKSMEADVKQLYVVVLDRLHIDYIRTYFPSVKGATIGYLMGRTTEKGIKPINERSIDILFSGTFDDERGLIKDLNSDKNDMDKLVLDCIEYMYNNSHVSTEKAIKDRIERRLGCDPGKEYLYELFSDIWLFIDVYMRKYNRRIVLEKIADAGLPLTLCGNGWENFRYVDNPNVSIRPSVDFDETFDLMADARICVNVMPMFKAGIHDRILSALQNGAVIATDESEVICERFEDGKDSLIFSLDSIDSFVERIRELLEDQEKLQSIADGGIAKIREFTMVENVGSILEMLYN